MFCTASEINRGDALNSYNLEDIDVDIVNFFNEDDVDDENLGTHDTENQVRKRRRTRSFEQNSVANRAQVVSNVLDELAALFESQRGHRDPHYLTNYKIINWPEGIDVKRLFWTGEEIEEIRGRMKELIFVPHDDHEKEKRMETADALRTVFQIHRPGETCPNLHNYEILNWPNKVSKSMERWSMFDCEKIQASLNKLAFLPLNLENKTRLNELRFLELIPGKVLNEKLNRSEVHYMLLERFRRESGRAEAVFIQWSLLNRSAVPAKYSKVALNCNTIGWKNIYQNSEIIDNIHFRRNL